MLVDKVGTAPGPSALPEPAAPAGRGAAPGRDAAAGVRPAVGEPAAEEGARAQAGPNQPQETPSLQSVIEALNIASKYLKTSLRFEVVPGQDVKVQVIDLTTGQVVKSVPPEDAIRAEASMRSLVGMLLDLRV